MKHPELWDRISEIPFPQGFVSKLRNQTRWKRDFADAVTEQYRRFVYLSQLGEGAVTPSKPVDKVWHLHLTYSRNYWEDWGRVLNRELHHEPAKPDDASGRYHEQYLRTRALLEREFGEPLPEAIWPIRAPSSAVPKWLGYAIALAGLGVFAVGMARDGAVVPLAGLAILVGALVAIAPMSSGRDGGSGGGGCGSSCGGGSCGD